VRRPSMVKTTGLVIVVPGLNVRDEERRNSDVSDGVGVIDDSREDVEGRSELGELLSREVVEGSELEGGCVESDSSVVLGGSLVGEEDSSLSTRVSRDLLSDGRSVRGAWWFRVCRDFRGGTRGSAHPVAVWHT
jgi:hypothetical protein